MVNISPPPRNLPQRDGTLMALIFAERILPF